MKAESTLPPTADAALGWQVLQELARERSLLAALGTMQAHLGDVFRMSLPNFNPVVAVGPEANRAILVTEQARFRWRTETDPVTRLLRHGLLVEDGESHHCLRRDMEPLLQRPQVMGHVESMWRYTDDVTAGWQGGATVDMLVEMRRVALLILVGTLFGVELGPRLDSLWPSILRLLEYIGPGLWIVWPSMPRPGYKRAIRTVDEYLYHMIRQRRQTGGSERDLLGHLVRQPHMSDALIRDQLLTMLIAGHDTSTALLAWTLYLLGRHPRILAQVQAEVDAALGAMPPSAGQVAGLPLLEQVIKETLRLYPPIHVGNRQVHTDTQLQGYDVPAGTRVMVSIYLSHRHPAYWIEPGRFCPARFDPEQTRQQPPLTYLPFGGGPRYCIGAAFAQVEARAVLARLLQTFEFELVSDKVRPHMGATLEPRPGVFMRIKRRRDRRG
jgi:cytochrome P450